MQPGGRYLGSACQPLCPGSRSTASRLPGRGAAAGGGQDGDVGAAVLLSRGTGATVQNWHSLEQSANATRPIWYPRRQSAEVALTMSFSQAFPKGPVRS